MRYFATLSTAAALVQDCTGAAAGQLRPSLGSASRLVWLSTEWQRASESKISMVDYISDLTGEGLVSDVVLGSVAPAFGGGVTSGNGAKTWEFTSKQNRENSLEYLRNNRHARLWVKYVPTVGQLAKFAPKAEEQAHAMLTLAWNYNYNGGLVVDLRDDGLLDDEKNLVFFADFIEVLHQGISDVAVLIKAEHLAQLEDEKKAELIVGKASSDHAPNSAVNPVTVFVYYDIDDDSNVDALSKMMFGRDSAQSIPTLAGAGEGIRLFASEQTRRFVLAMKVVSELSAARINELLARAAKDVGYGSGIFVADDNIAPYPAEAADYFSFVSRTLPKLAGFTQGGHRPASLFHTQELVTITLAVDDASNPPPTAVANSVLIQNCQSEMGKAVSYYVPLCKNFCSTLTDGRFCEIDNQLAACVLNRMADCKPHK